MNDLEQRLRAAYAAKAATITEDRLRPDAAARPFGEMPLAPVVPLRRRRTPFLAAAAVAALAGGVVAAVALTGGAPARPAHPAPNPTSHPAPHPTGARGTDTVPWDRVGSGWTLVQRSKAGRTTLELISPTAAMYPMATLPPNASATLWSPDAQRVLVTDQAGVRQLTLRTGALRTVPIPAGTTPVSYTRPTGTALLAVGPDGVLRRYDVATGALQQAYPRTVPGIGALNVQQPLYDADGGMLALGAQHGVAVLANDGRLVHAYPAPAGTDSCYPVRWNGTSSVDVACGSTDVINLWRLPLDGVAAIQLTRGPHGNNLFGYTDRWAYSGGYLGLAPNGCGPASLVRFAGDGTGSEVSVPRPKGVTGPLTYEGHAGDAVVLMGVTAGQCAPQGHVLLRYDAATGTTRVLAPAVDGNGVLQPEPVVLPQDR